MTIFTSTLKSEDRLKVLNVLKKHYDPLFLAGLTDPQFHEMYTLHAQKPNPYEGSLTSIQPRIKDKNIKKKPHGCNPELKVKKECPQCGQNVTLRRESVSAQMARCLLLLYRLQIENPNTEYFHIAEHCKHLKISYANASFAKAANWGLIKSEPNHSDPSKNHSGKWKLTQFGIAFVLNQVKIENYLYVYNNTIYDKPASEPDIKMVGIEYCLGKYFDYRDLMGQTPND